MATVPRKKWWNIQWYSDEDTPEERKVIVKLDLIIVPYAVLSYWVKYIDQSNLSKFDRSTSRTILISTDNAYISGLKEDLGFNGNQLVQLQTFYIIGAVTGQIPFMFLFTYIPMYWAVPFLDVMWGVFTLLQYHTTTFAELAAYRFLVGWFEVRAFPCYANAADMTRRLSFPPCTTFLVRLLLQWFIVTHK